MSPPVKTPKPPGASSSGIIFDRDTGVRVLDATRYVEGMRKNTPPARRERPSGRGVGAVVIQLTSDLSGASGSTLGAGTGVVQLGTGTAITAPGGTPRTVNVYSNDTESVNSGSYVVGLAFRDGFMVVHARCGDLG